MRFTIFLLALAASAAVSSAGRDFGFTSEPYAEEKDNSTTMDPQEDLEVTTSDPLTTEHPNLDLEEMKEDEEGDLKGLDEEDGDAEEEGCEEDPGIQLVQVLKPVLLSLVGLLAMYFILCHIHKNIKLWVKHRNNSMEMAAAADVEAPPPPPAAPEEENDQNN